MEEFIRFPCPACAKSVKAKPDQAGKRVRCPSRDCAQVIRVPLPLSAEPDQAPRKLWPWLAGAAAALVLAVGISAWLLTRDKGGPRRPQPPSDSFASVPPAGASPTATTTDGDIPPAPNESIAAKLSLPGKNGPRVDFLKTRDASIRIADVYVDTTVPFKSAKPAKLPTSFPSGTAALNIMVEFDVNPPRELDLTYEIRTRNGKMDTAPKEKGRFATSMYIDHNRTLCLFVTPAAGFPDGPYHALLRINGKDHAVLNWSVGQ